MGRPLEIGLSLATGFILSTPPTRLQQQALVNNLEQDNLDPFQGGNQFYYGILIPGSKWQLSLMMEMNIIKSQHYIVDDLSPCLFSCLPFEHKMLENVCLGKSPIIQKENICKLRFLKTVFWVTLTMVAVSLKILLYEKKRVWMNECLTIQKTNRQWYLYIEDLKKPARQAGKT